MPRYYFNIYDRRSEPDEVGMELADSKAARVEATRFAGRIIDDEADCVAVDEGWYMEVTTESGLIVFRLDFLVTEAPVVHWNEKSWR